MSDEPRIDVYDENGVLQSSQPLEEEEHTPDVIRYRAGKGVIIYAGETAEFHLPPTEFS